MVHIVDSLNQYGFDAAQEAASLQRLSVQDRIQRFTQQRESYVNHLLEDQAVSILYKYWPGENKNIFISPQKNEEDNIIHQIDFNERNGLFYEGILKSVDQAVKNPGSLFALYSPTGKKIFDDTPKDSIPKEKAKWLNDPYDIGQLYFLYFDGGKINNVAISVNNDSNPWLVELSEKFSEINLVKNEEQRIAKFLQTPISLGNIDDFFNRSWSDNHHIFKNVHNENFYLNEVIWDIRETFAGRKKIKKPINYDQTIQALRRSIVTAEVITQGYMTAVHHVMMEKRIEVMKFGGGCPGDGAEMSVVEQILGYDVLSSFVSNDNMFTKSTSSFSSTFRDLKQHKNKDDENSDEYGLLQFNCPVCNQEHTRKPHKLFVNCPKYEAEGEIKPIPKC